jgi:hypothetical protein
VLSSERLSIVCSPLINPKDTKDAKAKQVGFSIVSIVSVVFMPSANQQLETDVEDAFREAPEG